MAGRSLAWSIAGLGWILSACNDDIDRHSYVRRRATSVAEDASTSAGPSGVPFAPLPPGCAPFGDQVPKTLSCTGLYGDLGAEPAEKIVHPANRNFVPGVTLYTDGADKQRWIALPPSAQIDTSDANGWVFPEGTRVWKEFAFQGKRVETRLMYKKDGTWNFATYRWNDAETEATSVDGASVTLPSGRVHDIPKIDQCNECHRGSRDKLLGFEQVMLGLAGAEGVDLATLVAEQRLTSPPDATHLTIPDDGTGMAAQALGYIHVNCGVSCHNETGNAQANMSHMYLRIDASQLADTPPSEWNVVKLTVNVPSMTANFFGGTRIAPGAPDDSVLIKLAQTRGSNEAMPPIGTNYVDTEGLAAVREWITRLGTLYPAADGGQEIDGSAPEDASALPSTDGGVADASVVDAADAELADPEAGFAESGADAAEPVAM
jgi:hypothetical protein